MHVGAAPHREDTPAVRFGAVADGELGLQLQFVVTRHSFAAVPIAHPGAVIKHAFAFDDGVALVGVKRLGVGGIAEHAVLDIFVFDVLSDFEMQVGGGALEYERLHRPTPIHAIVVDRYIFGAAQIVVQHPLRGVRAGII